MNMSCLISHRKKRCLNLFTKVLFISIIFSCSLYAQDVISIYRKYIPKEVLENEAFLKMVSSNIEAKAELHPDLIYYNLVKLQKQYSEKDREKFNLLKQHVSQVENSYMARRTKWTQKQIDDANKSNYINEMKREIVNYFTPLLRDTMNKSNETSSSFETDYNLLHFYACVYMQKDTSAVYDPKIDYQVKRKELEKVQLDYFKNIYALKEPEKSISINRLMEEIFLRWYLFENKGNETGNPENLSIALQTIMKIVNKNYTISDSPNFFIEAGYSIKNSLFTTTNEYPVVYKYLFSYSTQNQNYTNPVADIKPDMPQLAISAGYRLMLKKHYGFMSFIEFSLLASLSLQEKQSDYITTSTNQYKVENIDITEKRGFTENHMKIHSINNYIVKVGVPIFALGNKFSVSLAANAGIVHLSSTTNYTYYLNKTEGYYTNFGSTYYSHQIATGSGKGNFEVNKNYFVFYPTLELIYDTSLGMRLRGVVNNNYIALMCGMAF